MVFKRSAHWGAYVVHTPQKFDGMLYCLSMSQNALTTCKMSFPPYPHSEIKNRLFKTNQSRNHSVTAANVIFFC